MTMRGLDAVQEALALCGAEGQIAIEPLMKYAESRNFCAMSCVKHGILLTQLMSMIG